MLPVTARPESRGPRVSARTRCLDRSIPRRTSSYAACPPFPKLSARHPEHGRCWSLTAHQRASERQLCSCRAVRRRNRTKNRIPRRNSIIWLGRISPILVYDAWCDTGPVIRTRMGFDGWSRIRCSSFVSDSFRPYAVIRSARAPRTGSRVQQSLRRDICTPRY